MVYKHECVKHKGTFNCFKIDIYSIPESKTGSVNVTLNICILKLINYSCTDDPIRLLQFGQVHGS